MQKQCAVVPPRPAQRCCTENHFLRSVESVVVPSAFQDYRCLVTDRMRFDGLKGRVGQIGLIQNSVTVPGDSGFSIR